VSAIAAKPHDSNLDTVLQAAERVQEHFAAIVTSSDDAIVSKDLNGIIQSWNKGAERIFGHTAEEAVGQPVLILIPAERQDEEPGILERIRRGERIDHYETVRQRKDGSLINISLTVSPIKNRRGEIIGASKIARDITEKKRNEAALMRQSRQLAILNQIAKTLSADLDLERIVQAVADICTELSGAQFGAFFYNVPEDGLVLHYALAGAKQPDFRKLDLPAGNPIFHATIEGLAAVRSDDIRADARFGKNAPHRGLPDGHPPLASYLGVPVVSRTGEALGGLFFGHEEPGRFTPEAEQLVLGVAAHAALAMDNARLHRAAQVEVEQRKRAEQATELLLHEIKHRVKNTLGTVQAIASQTFRDAPREERESFTARLRALSGAHDLLTRQDFDQVRVDEIVALALAPFQENRSARIHTSGDVAILNSNQALLLAMAIHELATNAVKYGALSGPAGQVDVRWTVEKREGRRLSLTWRESGGPPVAPPSRRGFGTTLIERALKQEQGASRMRFDPGGLCCALEIAL
jgi:PAS domain S-box-containing protein